MGQVKNTNLTFSLFAIALAVTTSCYGLQVQAQAVDKELKKSKLPAERVAQGTVQEPPFKYNGN